MFRWILLLVLFVAAIYVAVMVPFGGSTLADRLLDSLQSSSQRHLTTEAKQAVERETTTTRTKADTDRLTDEDRAGLENLIESKLKEDGGKDLSPTKP